LSPENVIYSRTANIGIVFRLQIYDETGAEVGQMTATHTNSAPDILWWSPFEYEYEITYQTPERWDSVGTALQQSMDPYEVGKTGEGAIETDKLSFVPDCVIRIDKDGPEAYLGEVVALAEWHMAASTEIAER